MTSTSDLTYIPKVMNREILAKTIFDVAYLQGEFRLRSGQISSEYFDKYRFESQPKILANIAEHLAPMIPTTSQCLAGLEMGGIPIATALSLRSGLPCLFVRKNAKDYGTAQVAEGLPSLSGLEVCVIEDVVTTGGQVILSTKDLRALGARVKHVLCVIQRDPTATEKLAAEGLTLHTLFTMDDLKP